MKTTIKKLYNSRAFWMIVSLIASLGIWVYVSSVETEEFKQTFRGVEVRLAGSRFCVTPGIWLSPIWILPP